MSSSDEYPWNLEDAESAPAVTDYIFHDEKGLYIDRVWANIRLLSVVAIKFEQLVLPGYFWKCGTPVCVRLWQYVQCMGGRHQGVESWRFYSIMPMLLGAVLQCRRLLFAE